MPVNSNFSDSGGGMHFPPEREGMPEKKKELQNEGVMSPQTIKSSGRPLQSTNRQSLRLTSENTNAANQLQEFKDFSISQFGKEPALEGMTPEQFKALQEVVDKHPGDYSVKEVVQEIAKIFPEQEDMRAKGTAHFINTKHIPLVELHNILEGRQVLDACKYIEYVDFRGFPDQYIQDVLVKKMRGYHENIKHLIIHDSNINGLPKLRNCQTFDCVGCTRLASSMLKAAEGGRHQKWMQGNSSPVRASLAKLCAQNNPEATARNIKWFCLEDEADQIEIAKLCAQQDVRATVTLIGQFKIQEQTARVEIAKLCAQQDATLTAEHIEKFGIDNEEDRITIAKLCAEKPSPDFFRHIWEFRIPSERREDLIDIFKTSAESDPQCIKDIARSSPYVLINRWDTSESQAGQEACAEIARHCARQNGKITAKYLKEFKIDEPKVLTEIGRLCVEQEPSQSTAVEILKLIRNPEDLPSAKELEPIIRSLIDHSLNRTPQHKDLLHDKLNDILAEKNPQRRKAYRFSQELLVLSKLEQEPLDWLLSSHFWRQLQDLHDPKLRNDLIRELAYLSSNVEQRELWTELLPQSASDLRLVHLIALPLFTLAGKGLDPQTLKATFQFLTESKQGKWKDKVFVRNMLKTLMHFASTNTLDSKQKALGINKILSSPNHQQTPSETQAFCDVETLAARLRAVRGLLLTGNKSWTESEKDIRDLYQGKITEVVPADGYKGDLVKGYEENFLKSRHPDGLLQYAAGIKSLEDERANDCLGRFVRSVIEGSFATMRYETNDNLHLATVFKGRPELEKAWKQEMKFDFDELSDKAYGVVKQDWEKQWLENKIIRDKHLGEEVRPTSLEAVLNDPRKKDNLIKQLAENKTERVKALKKKKIKSPNFNEDPEYRNIMIEDACIKLIGKSEKDALPMLKKLLKLVPQDLQFHQDVDDLIKTIKSKPKGQASHSVVITHDPLDLLYIGTDVQSCMNVNGEPYDNIGLLGPLVDGKIKLLAIKNNEGWIVSRCLLKLMWDGSQPVLYQEVIYPMSGSPDDRLVLNEAAKEYARSLGVPLTTGDNSGGKKYPSNLHALGGGASHEYSDANGGITLGKYSHAAWKVEL